MTRFNTVLFLAVALFAAAAQAQIDPKVSPLTQIDRDFMESQRESVDELARVHLGRQIRGEKANDLEVLQQLLDRDAVQPDQTVLLQAMGVVLGDVLSAELDMPWVIYEDDIGRSRALRAGESEHFLFPVTMIARRVEAGAPVDVDAVYAKAVSLIEPHLPARPFQYD
jgi:hypothetical protein